VAEVFKVQRPIFGDMSVALVYNRSRSSLFQVPLGSVLGLFQGEELKVYWLGEKTASGLFEGIRRVPDQDW